MLAGRTGTLIHVHVAVTAGGYCTLRRVFRDECICADPICETWHAGARVLVGRYGRLRIRIIANASVEARFAGALIHVHLAASTRGECALFFVFGYEIIFISLNMINCKQKHNETKPGRGIKGPEDLVDHPTQLIFIWIFIC